MNNKSARHVTATRDALPRPPRSIQQPLARGPPQHEQQREETPTEERGRKEGKRDGDAGSLEEDLDRDEDEDDREHLWVIGGGANICSALRENARVHTDLGYAGMLQ